MPPLESARRIIEHVPEGVRLMREHKLGERPVDFVLEHHRTSPVHYFLARGTDNSLPGMVHRRIRYPGQTPSPTPDA